jgi:hypothetical protein
MNTNSLESENRDLLQFEKMFFVFDGTRSDGHLDSYVSNIIPIQLVTFTQKGAEVYEFDYKTAATTISTSSFSQSLENKNNDSINTNVIPTSKTNIDKWSSTIKLQSSPDLSFMVDQPTLLAKIKTSTAPDFKPKIKCYTHLSGYAFITTYDDDRRIDIFDLKDPYKKTYGEIIYDPKTSQPSTITNNDNDISSRSSSSDDNPDTKSNVNITVRNSIVNLISKSNLFVCITERKVYAYQGGYQEVYSQSTYHNPNGVCVIVQDPTNSLGYYLCFPGTELGSIRLVRLSLDDPRILSQSAHLIIFQGENISAIAIDNLAQCIAVTNQTGTTVKIINIDELNKLFNLNYDIDHLENQLKNTNKKDDNNNKINDNISNNNNCMIININIQRTQLISTISNHNESKRLGGINQQQQVISRKNKTKVTRTKQNISEIIYPVVVTDPNHLKKLMPHQFRRGRNLAKIYSLTFNKTGKHLLCSSDRGKIHIFSLDPSIPNESLFSSFPFPAIIVSMISSDQWSFASFQVDSQKKYIACFGDELNTVHVVTENNLFYTLKYMKGKMIQGPVYILKSTCLPYQLSTSSKSKLPLLGATSIPSSIPRRTGGDRREKESPQLSSSSPFSPLSSSLKKNSPISHLNLANSSGNSSSSSSPFQKK